MKKIFIAIFLFLFSINSVFASQYGKDALFIPAIKSEEKDFFIKSFWIRFLQDSLFDEEIWEFEQLLPFFAYDFDVISKKDSEFFLISNFWDKKDSEIFGKIVEKDDLRNKRFKKFWDIYWNIIFYNNFPTNFEENSQKNYFLKNFLVSNTKLESKKSKTWKIDWFNSFSIKNYPFDFVNSIKINTKYIKNFFLEDSNFYFTFWWITWNTIPKINSLDLKNNPPKIFLYSKNKKSKIKWEFVDFFNLDFQKNKDFFICEWENKTCILNLSWKTMKNTEKIEIFY